MTAPIPAPEVAASAWWIPGLSAVVGAVVGSLCTGIFTLWATDRQQKGQIHRESMLIHEKRHDMFIERISNIVKTAGWFYVSKHKTPNTEWNNEKTSQTVQLVQQIVQVELMLDMTKETHVAVRDGMHNVRDCAFADGRRLNAFEDATKILTERCLTLLRRESEDSP